MNSHSVFAALCLAFGIAGAGYFLGSGISNRNQSSRISVKGLAEREVPASIAIWTINYSATGDALTDINARLGESAQAVQTFLKESGFEPTDVALQPPRISDHNMETRDKDTEAPVARFSAAQSVLVRTTKVDQIKPAVTRLSGLMEKGVVFTGDNDPKFFFTDLNAIKPGMIEEATKNARIAAEQFARDSKTELGRLNSANQGWFQVENRDEATQERKVVRVIVEVEYEIE